MATRVCFAALLLISVMAGAGLGQGQPHNGFWWEQESSQNFRLGFASGYAMAMGRVFDAASMQCAVDKMGGDIKKTPTDKVMDDCLNDPSISRYDFTRIPFGQLTNGVDEFYKDFRNKGIEVNEAMFYVRDQLKGKSPQELEDELNRWRQIRQH